MGIEPIAPTLQESVAPLEHASPQYSLSAFTLGLDPPSSVGGLGYAVSVNGGMTKFSISPDLKTIHPRKGSSKKGQRLQTRRRTKHDSQVSR